MRVPGWVRSGIEVRVAGVVLLPAIPLVLHRALLALSGANRIPRGTFTALVVLLLVASVLAFLLIVDLLDAAGLLRWRASLPWRLWAAALLYLLAGSVWHAVDPTSDPGVLLDLHPALTWPHRLAASIGCPGGWWRCLPAG